MVREDTCLSRISVFSDEVHETQQSEVKIMFHVNPNYIRPSNSVLSNIAA